MMNRLIVINLLISNIVGFIIPSCFTWHNVLLGEAIFLTILCYPMLIFFRMKPLITISLTKIEKTQGKNN